MGGGFFFGLSPPAFARAPHADESGDSISPERLGIIRRGSRSADGEASESQAECVAAAFVATRDDEIEWKGSISFLREQLAAQVGVKLVLDRVDVERLLEELTSSAPV